MMGKCWSQKTIRPEARAFIEFYEDLLGTPSTRNYTLLLDVLGRARLQLSGLNDRFMEHEVWSVIISLPPNKAPGPDGFVGQFLQVAWLIIQSEIMVAFDAL
jgi:hypothetical protein